MGTTHLKDVFGKTHYQLLQVRGNGADWGKMTMQYLYVVVKQKTIARTKTAKTDIKSYIADAQETNKFESGLKWQEIYIKT